MQNASRLVLNLAQAAHRNDRWALTNALRAIVQNEEKKNGGGIAEHLRQLIPRTGKDGRPHKAQQYLDEIAPKLEIHNLVLADDVHQACAELVHEQRHAGVLGEAGLRPRNRVLLTGPPGNGKTSLAEWIAATLDRPFYSVGYDTLIGNYLGQTGNRLRQVVDYVGSHECVVLFDEFEGVAKEREDGHETGEIKRVIASLLVHLDRLPASTIVVAATNHPGMLDRATWRRFQIRLELTAPDRMGLNRYLQQRQPDLPRRQIEGAATAMKTEGASHADAAEFCDDIDRRVVLYGQGNPERMFHEALARWMTRRGNSPQDSTPAPARQA